MPLSSGDQAAAAPAPLLAGEGGSPGEGLLLFRGSRSGVPGPFSFLVLPTYAGILQLSLYQLDLLPVSRRLSVGTPLCVEVLLTCLPGGGGGALCRPDLPPPCLSGAEAELEESPAEPGGFWRRTRPRTRAPLPPLLVRYVWEAGRLTWLLL